jgi:V/A-type H+-transporting ATPase subunit D
VTRLALNKASLARESKRLKIYQRYLPSLDLKRRQLIAERIKAKQVLEHTRHEIEQIRYRASRDLPMLANEAIDLAGLARITDVAIVDENLLGTVLPKLTAVAVTVRNYSTLATPHWIDPLAHYLKQVLEMRVRAQVEGERLARLEQAVRTVTQRVNLFDKVLMPRTRERIKRITVYLSDAERAAVVRAKIARAKSAEGAAP